MIVPFSSSRFVWLVFLEKALFVFAFHPFLLPKTNHITQVCLFCRTGTPSEQRHHHDKSFYTLEYSVNFHRHVVKHENRVVESFLWLDDALSKYPGITLLPTLTSFCSPSVIAGGGLNETNAYPIIGTPASPSDKSTSATNIAAIYETLQNLLYWYPKQVDELLNRWPPIAQYPANVLRERLLFLMAPLPPEHILQRANVTDNVDWPQLFYRSNCSVGAGMSVGQISHALQVLPEPLLLRLWHHTATTNSSISNNDMAGTTSGELTLLIEQTPALVLKMTHSLLDLWVTGVSSLDTLILAHLHWRGTWEWPSCRIVLHAFPACQPCSVNEHGTNNQNAQCLHYLQQRLHLRPWHVHAMCCTHSRLTGYSARNCKRNLDFLQEKLELRSVDVRALILQMPSLLGAGVDSLESRVDFWTIQVGLTVPELQKAVATKPALLQYSVTKNLQPKLDFFSGRLGISVAELVRMTCINPELWGRSMDRYLLPVANVFYEASGLTPAEYGKILVRFPKLLRYSVANLRGKLQFLRQRLCLGSEDLKEMVMGSPRILMASIETSLVPKIELIASFGNETYREAIQQHPSLLSMPKTNLKQRMRRLRMSSDRSLADSLAKSRRKNKSIWLLSQSGKTEREFRNVLEAAEHAKTSKSNMYVVLRQGRLLKGRRYVYGTTARAATMELKPTDPSLLEKVRNNNRIFDELRNNNRIFDGSGGEERLVIYSAGRAFPPEDTVRGRRRSGGMALQIKTWSSVDWRRLCANMWNGQRLRLLPDGQSLILGYPYIRPSRPRCSLYVCHEALRVASSWLSQVSATSIEISIVSSNYVVDLLQNSSQILEWGSAKTKDDFIFTGPGELHKANPDILYPLARTYYQLMEQSSMKNVTVSFLPADRTNDSLRRLYDGASLAAKLMYSSER